MPSNSSIISNFYLTGEPILLHLIRYSTFVVKDHTIFRMQNLSNYFLRGLYHHNIQMGFLIRRQQLSVLRGDLLKQSSGGLS